MPKKNKKGAWSLADALREVDAMVLEEARDPDVWRDAKPKHLVALHARCHRDVYGAELSLAEAERARAAFAASRLATAEFRGDYAEAVEFMRWAWEREMRREKARRAGTTRDDRTLTWTFLFCARYVLNDYRVERAREASSPRMATG